MEFYFHSLCLPASAITTRLYDFYYYTTRHNIFDKAIKWIKKSLDIQQIFFSMQQPPYPSLVWSLDPLKMMMYVGAAGTEYKIISPYIRANYWYDPNIPSNGSGVGTTSLCRHLSWWPVFIPWKKEGNIGSFSMIHQNYMDFLVCCVFQSFKGMLLCIKESNWKKNAGWSLQWFFSLYGFEKRKTT